MRTFRLSCFLFFLVMTCPVMGQVLQKQLTEEDYKLWSTMEVEELSDTGKWASYSVHYESVQDTLFVKNTKMVKTYAFPNGINGKFVKEKWFVCQGNSGQLILTNLINGKQETLKGVTSYVITKDSRFIIIHRKAEDDNQELLIRDMNGKDRQLIPKVVNYSYNSKANALICDSNRKLMLLYLDDIFKNNLIDDIVGSEFSDFVWQKNGKSVAFLYWDNITKVGYYRLAENELYKFDSSKFSSFPNDSELYNASSTTLTIADDGSKVFFGVKPKEVPQDTTGVQIWNTADKSLYPEKRLIKGWQAVPKLAVWFPKNNQFRMLTNNEFPNIMLTGNQKKALVYNPIANEPQFDHSAPIDFYLYDIETEQQKLILPKQSPDESKLSISGSGRYLAYFKDKHWWIYDISDDKHYNITSSVETSFEREDYDRSGEKEACGIVGWADNDDSLLIYDSYDVWIFKTDGSGGKRLTHGWEEHIIYRVVGQKEFNFPINNFNWTQKGTFSLDNGLLLQAKSDYESGYFKWDPKKGVKKLIFDPYRINNYKDSGDNTVFIYTKEHFHLAPQIVVQFKNTNESKVFYQSNSQQKKYQWGFSKLIKYHNAKGKLLKGALFYPAGYSPKKVYPMVVQIYERLSSDYNQYVNPTMFNSVGFNISNFTSKGYFVLLPDIVYDEGQTGKSAVDCVLSVVNEVLTHEPVDPKRLGLIGHSFGGYETNFIITQTNIFAAAISGAGASDIISNYLYVAWNISKHNGWRYEYQQSRMGVSPFDDYKRYIDNSPITYAKQIETPVLLWSGEEDKQVHYFQSLEFHLALRRLQKPNILLLYEGERHTIKGKSHQIDLTHRYQDWFDYYLKGGNRPDWFVVDRL